MPKSLKDIAVSVGIDVQLNRVGSMMTGFFTKEPVTDFLSAMKADAVQICTTLSANADWGNLSCPLTI